MAPPKNILLLGGHGKVSLLLTPKLLSRSWNVTSLIRSQSQTPSILSLQASHPGKLSTHIASLSEIKSISDAQKIISATKPDTIIWSAGAGGKGGPEMTNAIDQEACIHFIPAALSTPSVTRFMVVSALSIRRQRAPWFSEDDYALTQKVNTKIMPAYYAAKLAADDVLAVEGRARAEKDGFQWISLRPGQLSDDAEVGKVSLGKTKARGAVTRGDVAEVGAQLLEREGVRGWFDLLGGDEDVGEAVERVLREKVDCLEGEDWDAMVDSAAKL